MLLFKCGIWSLFLILTLPLIAWMTHAWIFYSILSFRLLYVQNRFHVGKARFQLVRSKTTRTSESGNAWSSWAYSWPESQLGSSGIHSACDNEAPNPQLGTSPLGIPAAPGLCLTLHSAHGQQGVTMSDSPFISLQKRMKQKYSFFIEILKGICGELLVNSTNISALSSISKILQGELWINGYICWIYIYIQTII